jgi:hypothetical protein
MRCPYCRSSIDQEAVVCPFCRSHVGLVNSLRARIDELEAELQELRHQFELQGQGQGYSGSNLSIGSERTSDSAGISGPDEPPSPRMSLTRHLFTGCFTVFLICSLHAITLFVYDLPPIIFRVMALVVPIVVSAHFHSRYRSDLKVSALIALVTAGTSVTLMLSLTARIDTVAMWPESSRDWKELFEFTSAIGLGYFTGALIGRALAHSKRVERHPPLAVLLLTKDDRGRYNVEAIAERVQSLVSSTAPIATGAVSLYSGLKSLIGDG